MLKRRTVFHPILAFGCLALCCVAVSISTGSAFAQGDGPPQPGSTIPAFTLPDIQGNDVAVPGFAGGKPILLTFWSTW